MKETEMRQIGSMIAQLIEEGEAAVPTVREQAVALCKAFPLYPEIG
jgi:glycine/serine hydroxymethyltransferase